MIIEAVV